MTPRACFLLLFLTPLVTCLPLVTKFVDLSHTFDDNALSWPGTKPFVKRVIHNASDPNEHWLHLEEVESGTHAGTHLDAPCHFAEGRWSVEEIPLNQLILPGFVVDISKRARNNSDSMLTILDLQKWEENHGRIPNGSLMMVRTGWSQFWPSESLYFGISNSTDEKHFPGVSPEAAQWLVDNRLIYGVGIDTGSVDNGQSTDYLAHRILARENIFNLENVANMEKLPVIGLTIFVGPMKIQNASGAPCRILVSFSVLKADHQDGFSIPSWPRVNTTDSVEITNSTEGDSNILDTIFMEMENSTET